MKQPFPDSQDDVHARGLRLVRKPYRVVTKDFSPANLDELGSLVFSHRGMRISILKVRAGDFSAPSKRRILSCAHSPAHYSFAFEEVTEYPYPNFICFRCAGFGNNIQLYEHT